MHSIFSRDSRQFLFALVCFLLVSGLILNNLLRSDLGVASSVDLLPKPTELLTTSEDIEINRLCGLSFDKDNPFKFDFIFEKPSCLSNNLAIQDRQRMIAYFLAALTLPKSKLWVNLSPYEKDRILPNELAETELGIDMLAQDYILKQLSASLSHPETDLGKRYWDAMNLLGGSEAIDELNKIWISADTAQVYVGTNVVLLGETKMKVETESDYLANKLNSSETKFTQMLRKEILPVISNEVNQGKHFIKLRQIYNAVVLATWFKSVLKEHVINQYYADKNKLEGIDSATEIDHGKLYERYLAAFNKGVYDLIKKEKIDGAIKHKKYFAGGATLEKAPKFTVAKFAEFESGNKTYERVSGNFRTIKKESSAIESISFKGQPWGVEIVNDRLFAYSTHDKLFVYDNGNKLEYDLIGENLIADHGIVTEDSFDQVVMWNRSVFVGGLRSKYPQSLRFSDIDKVMMEGDIKELAEFEKLLKGDINDDLYKQLSQEISNAIEKENQINSFSQHLTVSANKKVSEEQAQEQTDLTLNNFSSDFVFDINLDNQLSNDIQIRSIQENILARSNVMGQLFEVKDKSFTVNIYIEETTLSGTTGRAMLLANGLLARYPNVNIRVYERDGIGFQKSLSKSPYRDTGRISLEEFNYEVEKSFRTGTAGEADAHVLVSGVYGDRILNFLPSTALKINAPVAPYVYGKYHDQKQVNSDYASPRGTVAMDIGLRNKRIKFDSKGYYDIVSARSEWLGANISQEMHNSIKEFANEQGWSATEAIWSSGYVRKPYEFAVALEKMAKAIDEGKADLPFADGAEQVLINFVTSAGTLFSDTDYFNENNFIRQLNEIGVNVVKYDGTVHEATNARKLPVTIMFHKRIENTGFKRLMTDLNGTLKRSSDDKSWIAFPTFVTGSASWLEAVSSRNITVHDKYDVHEGNKIHLIKSCLLKMLAYEDLRSGKQRTQGEYDKEIEGLVDYFYFGGDTNLSIFSDLEKWTEISQRFSDAMFYFNKADDIFRAIEEHEAEFGGIDFELDADAIELLDTKMNFPQLSSSGVKSFGFMQGLAFDISNVYEFRDIKSELQNQISSYY